MKIRNKLIVVFIVCVLLISSASFIISYFGYQVVNGRMRSIDYNSDLVNQINEIEGLIAAQQRTLSAGIVGLDTSDSASFETKNSDTGAYIERLKVQSN